jgi:hypothetical protein
VFLIGLLALVADGLLLVATRRHCPRDVAAVMATEPG